jgi:hypothetical protein
MFKDGSIAMGVAIYETWANDKPFSINNSIAVAQVQSTDLDYDSLAHSYVGSKPLIASSVNDSTIPYQNFKIQVYHYAEKGRTSKLRLSRRTHLRD